MTEIETPESEPVEAPDQNEVEANAVASIERAVHSGDMETLRAALDEFSDSDARHIFFDLNSSQRAGLLRALDPESVVTLIGRLPKAEIGFLLKGIDPQAAADILAEFDNSDVVEILEELDDELADSLRSRLAPELARDLAAVELYEEDTAGWFMNPSAVRFQVEQTVGAVLRIIVDDEAALDSAQGQHPYVVTAEGRLLGVLSLRALLLAKRATPLSQVFIEATALTPEMTLEELKDFFDEHDYLGAPVVDAAGTLLGAVSKETVMDAWREEMRENVLKARGIVGDELRSMPLLFRSRRRLAWLSANIGLNVVAAGVIASFEDTLSQVIALAIFLPMVSDMSGCSGNQAVAVSMREISLGLARPSDLLKVWTKEVSVGVINGAILGVIIGIVAWIWMGNPVLGAVIGSALAINTIIAVSIGGCIPLFLKRFNIDPAVASGPLLTTITDMAGFFLVLSLATLFLRYLI